jgi:integrase
MSKMLLRDAFRRYALIRELSPKSVALYVMLFNRLDRFIGRPATVADLNDFTIAEYIEWRKVTPGWRGQIPRPATVKKDRSMIRACWEYLARKKIARQFPELPRVKVPKTIPTGRAYTADEVGRLIRTAKRRIGKTGGLPAKWWWPTLIYAAVCTGERFEALTSLRWGQVDLDRRRVIFLAGTRKGRTRDLERAITPQLAAMLAEHRRGPADLVWPWDRRTRSHWASLQVLCRTAGVEYRGRGFHGFRRMAASYAALAGGPSAATQLLDHSDPALQAVYVDPLICPRDTSSVDTLPPIDIGEPAAG